MWKEILITPWIDLGMEGIWIFLLLIFLSFSCSQIGVILLLNRNVLLADVVSHTVLPGIILAFLCVGHISSPWLLVGGAISALIAIMLIDVVQKKFLLKEDASMVLVFTSFFALGVFLSVRYGNAVDLDPSCILYGNLEHSLQDRFSFWGMSIPSVLPRTFSMLFGTLLILFSFNRIFFTSSFDWSFAQTCNFHPNFFRMILMLCFIFVVVDGFRIVGLPLILSFLILPSAFAFISTRKWKFLFPLAFLHSLFSCYLGVGVSYYFNCNTSAGVALCGAILFLIGWIFTPAFRVLQEFFRKQIRGENLFFLKS